MKRIFLVFLLFFSFCLFTSCGNSYSDTSPTPTQAPSTEITTTCTQTPTFTPTYTPTPTPKPKEKVIKNITYKEIDGKELRLDIYLPAQHSNSDKFGALFFYHGGGWMGGDKSDIIDYYDIVKALNAENIAVIAVQYRLCDAVNIFMPSPIYDCLDAVRYIVKNADTYNIDTENLGSFGTSAGGHLSLMAAFAQDHFREYDELSNVEFKLKYAVDICGPVDLCVDFSDESLRRAYETLLAVFGTDRDGKPEDYKASSPIYYINNNTPKTLIIHGKADTYVPVSQSETLYNALKDSGIDCSYIAVDGAEHNFSVGDGYETTSHSVEELLLTAVNFIINASAQ